jgi:hypothetical protein
MDSKSSNPTTGPTSSGLRPLPPIPKISSLSDNASKNTETFSPGSPIFSEKMSSTATSPKKDVSLASKSNDASHKEELSTTNSDLEKTSISSQDNVESVSPKVQASRQPRIGLPESSQPLKSRLARSISINILRHEVIQDKKPYTFFHIQVEALDNKWVVLRRFSQLYELHKKLSPFLPKGFPPFPSKTLPTTDNLDAEFISQRQQQLQTYLSAVASSREIIDSPELFSFLLKFLDPNEMRPVMTLKNAVKQGYLLKRAIQKPGYLKRYFVLYGSQLFYYETDKSSEPRKIIDLTCARIEVSKKEEVLDVKAEGQPIIQQQIVSYVFEVQTDNRHYYLKAASEEEMREWVIALRKSRMQSDPMNDQYLKYLELLDYSEQSLTTTTPNTDQRNLLLRSLPYTSPIKTTGDNASVRKPRSSSTAQVFEQCRRTDNVTAVHSVQPPDSVTNTNDAVPNQIEGAKNDTPNPSLTSTYAPKSEEVGPLKSSSTKKPLPPPPIRPKYRKESTTQAFGRSFRKSREAEDVSHVRAETFTAHSNTPLNAPAEDTPETIQYMPDGKIRVATFGKLFQKLCDPQFEDEDYLKTFLYTYNAYTTPSLLLEQIVLKFLKPCNDKDTELVLKEWLLNVLAKWVDLYPYDFLTNHKLRNSLMVFLTKDVPKSGIENLVHTANNIAALLNEKLNPSRDTKQMRTALIPIVPTLFDTGTFDFFDLDPIEVARQLTLIELRYFKEIHLKEFLEQAWNKSDREIRAPNITKMTNHFNEMSMWTSSYIVRPKVPKQRSVLIMRFIDVAFECYKLKNFTTCMAIMAGLDNCAVFRLQNSWKLVPTSQLEKYEELKEFFSQTGNWENYRQCLKTLQPPCIPFLGLYLTDLTFVDEAGKANQVSNSNQIAFYKYYKVAAILQQIAKFQQSEYNIIPLPQIQDYLSNLVVMNPDTMYQISLLQEQKDHMGKGPNQGIELGPSGKFKERGFTIVRGEMHTRKAPSLTETLRQFISGKPKDRPQQTISLSPTSNSNAVEVSATPSDTRQTISSSTAPHTTSDSNSTGEKADIFRKANKGISKLFQKISHPLTPDEKKN